MYFDKKEMRFKIIPEYNNQTQEVDRSNQENGMNVFDPKLKYLNIISSSTLVGTAEYSSPEMLNNRTVSALTSDIWALGCIIYKFFHGRTPFKARSDFLIIDNIMNMRYAISKDLTEEAQDLIRRLLVEDPKERLGCSKDGKSTDFASIKSHAFFKGFDFNNLNFLTPPIKLNTCPHFFLQHSKSTSSHVSLENFSINNLLSGDTHNSPIGLIKTNSTPFFKAKISNLNFDVSVENLNEFVIIKDYISTKLDDIRLKKRNSSETEPIYEGIVKKKSLLLGYKYRRLKLYENGIIELSELGQNQKNVTILINLEKYNPNQFYEN